MHIVQSPKVVYQVQYILTANNFRCTDNEEYTHRVVPSNQLAGIFIAVQVVVAEAARSNSSFLIKLTTLL